MNNIRKIFLLTYIILLISNTLRSQEENIAGSFIKLFITQKYPEAYSLFDSTVKSKISLGQFAEILPGIENSFGKFISIVDTTSSVDSVFEIYNFGCKFENGALNFKIVLNKNQQISGFWITPYTEKTDYKIPEYANPAKFKELNVEFGKSEWKLSATLTIPNRIQKPPVVVLIHGSGPNDRDETIGQNKPFKDIAWGLASNKIAVLRYDKRTKLYGHKINPKNVTVRDEVIDDVIEAVNFLKSRDDIDTNCIFLIGHSLGAMLAPTIANELESIRGIILLAAPARKLETLILNQLHYIYSLDEKLDDEEKKQLELLKNAIDSLDRKIISENTNILGMYPNYIYELRNLNPIKTIKNLKIPILILQGERDYQVTMEDFEIYKKEFTNNFNVQLKSYPKLNHLFMYGEEKSTPAETLKPNNVYKAVIQDIQDWIKSHCTN